MNHKNFECINTSTSGKEKNTQWRLALSPQGPQEGLYVGLVGSSSGLERHIKEAKELGYEEDRQVYIERNPECFEANQQKAKELGFKGRILFGDFLDWINQLQETITYVDFDDIATFSQYTRDVISFCDAQQIPICHIVVSTRRGSKYLKEELGFIPMINTQQDVIEKELETLSTYTCKCLPYRGRSGMLAIMLRRKHLTHKESLMKESIDLQSMVWEEIDTTSTKKKRRQYSDEEKAQIVQMDPREAAAAFELSVQQVYIYKNRWRDHVSTASTSNHKFSIVERIKQLKDQVEKGKEAERLLQDIQKELLGA